MRSEVRVLLDTTLLPQLDRVAAYARLPDGAEVRLSAAKGAVVRLDGEMKPTIDAAGLVYAVFTVPKDPALGARRLEVQERAGVTRVDIVTPAIEATRARLSAAVEIVRKHLPRSRGVFWYRSGTGRPRRYTDALAAAVFVTDAAAMLLSALGTVLEAPAWFRRSVGRVQPFVGAMDHRGTLDLLAKHPQLLATGADGRRRPTLVVENVTQRHANTPENRQLVAFLTAVLADTRPVLCRAAGANDEYRRHDQQPDARAEPAASIGTGEAEDERHPDAGSARRRGRYGGWG